MPVNRTGNVARTRLDTRLELRTRITNKPLGLSQKRLPRDGVSGPSPRKVKMARFFPIRWQYQSRGGNRTGAVAWA